MKLSAANVQEWIGAEFAKRRGAQGGTWSAAYLKEQDLRDLPHFYRNSFRRGLVESPEKRPHPYPYSTNAFSLRFFLKRYVPARLRAPSNRAMLRHECELLRESGIIFPSYDETHRDFYFDCAGQSFNANLRKYATFLTFVKLHTEGTVRSICEIGGGYGGLCELFVLNQDVSTYVIIDLFETLAVSMTYLAHSASLSDYALTYLESSEELHALDRHGRNIVFISTDAYGRFAKKALPAHGHIDLFINTNSFVEMPSAAVKEYFDFMEQFHGTYLFSSNALRRKEGDEMLSAAAFPYDAHWRHLHETVVERYQDLSRLSRRD